MRVSKEGFHQLLVKFFLAVEEVPAEVSIASRGNATAENQWRMNVLIALLWQCQCQCLVPFLSLYCQNSAIIKHYSHGTSMKNDTLLHDTDHRSLQLGWIKRLSEIKPKLTELFQALADVRWTIFFSIVNVRRGALNSSLCAIVLLCLRGNCVLMRWTHERDFKSKLSWAGVCCLACASVF